MSGSESTISPGRQGLGRAVMSLLGMLIVLAISCHVATAAESLSINVGFDGRFKVGKWTPIVVDNVVNGARMCEALVIDPDGVRVSHSLQRQATEERNGASRWSGLVRSGRLDGVIEVRVHADDTKTIQSARVSPARLKDDSPDDSGRPDAIRCFPLRQSESVWLEIGTSIELLKPTRSLHVVRSAQWPAAAEIPSGLDGIDGIWVTSRTPLSDAAKFELQRWLRRGGHLVVTIATDSEEFQQTPWSELLTSVMELRGRTRTNDLSGIESFSVHGRKIAGANRSVVTVLSPKEGRTLISCLEGPLVVRATFGVGQVTVLGIDPSTQPLSRWDGRTAFVKRLLLQVAEQESSKSLPRSALSQSGITDLASQWRAAAIDMPEVTRPSLWTALGLLLLYAAVIGPFDYLLVHKVLRRPHWTWISLPLLVVVASLGTAWLARAANGDAARLTQLDILDIDAGRQEVTARSWTTAYSVSNAFWNIEATPNLPGAGNSERVLSWLGFPENASGGMYRDSGFDTGHALYRSAPGRALLEGIPISQWSSKSLTSEATWQSEATLVDSRLASTSAGELSGSVVHHLPFELRDWIVVFEKWIYRPHPRFGESATRWPAKQPWTPKDERNYGRELRGFLTRTTATKKQAKKGVVSEDVLVEQERYNPMNIDPSDILQMMTLHEAAGGKAYTGLDHHSLRAFDLSPLLSLDRAIVIARVTEPTTQWRFNGEGRQPTRHHGFVRFVLPVKRIGDESGLRTLPKFEVHQPAPAETPKDSANNETKSP